MSALSFHVYLVTNSANGRRYIGVTGKSPKRRLREHLYGAVKRLHNGRFYRAIRKYGAGCFSVETIRICSSREETMAAEIELIAALKPEYNSTLGGDGQLGRKMTERARAALSAANRGKQRRLGTTHTEATRAVLRELGIRNKDKWQKYSHLGPKAQEKPIICLDDGRSFASCRAASRFYEIDAGTIAKVCLNYQHRKTAGGLRFEFAT